MCQKGVPEGHRRCPKCQDIQPKTTEFFRYRKDEDKWKHCWSCHQAMKYGHCPPWMTDAHWDQIFALYLKSRLLTAETGVQHVIDHIQPRKGKDRSGLHVPWNLQIVDDAWNQKKANKAPETLTTQPTVCI